MIKSLKNLVTFILVCILFASSNAYASIRDVCPGFKIDSKKIINFNANEKKLICGDPDAASWEDIPRFQSEYFIKTFMQERGYFFPTFTEEDDTVIIHPGEEARVKSIEVEGSPPPFFDVTRRRKIKGQVLTPSILNTLENWTVSQMRSNGYPCPKIKSEADPKTGVVTLNVEPGPYQKIAKVIEEPVEGLRAGTLKRYRAFNIGDPYNAQNLDLTSARIETIDGILQSSYFLTECSEEGATLTQKSLTGPRRLVIIGVGASTEDFIIGKLTLKWTRIGLNGSSIQLSGQGSYRKQSFKAQGFIYPFSRPTRWHLNPIAGSKRYDEKQYEYTSIDAILPMAVTWDTQNVGFRLRFGPKYNFIRTQRGADPGNTHFLSANMRLDAASHNYQYYATDPREGFLFGIGADFNHDQLGSSVTAQKMWASGQALWNIASFDPPLVLLALRGLVGLTFTDTGSSSFSRLPPSFFYYLGGSASLRGFSRRQLPNASRGALTALYTGAEARLTNVLPLNFQPLFFVDFGILGQKSFDLDYPVYWSPGFGVRWPSMVGVFRFTVGHGFLINNNVPANEGLKHWQFYFSFGEEF